MEFKDYYKILELDQQATIDDIRRAHRKLARKYHPEINPNDTAMAQHYQDLNEAHEVLTDPDKRAKYNSLWESWQTFLLTADNDDFDWSQWASGEPLTQESDFSPFYQAVFGNMEPLPLPAEMESLVNIKPLEITLEESFKGASRILKIGNQQIKINIPKGVRGGTKIRVRGKEGQNLGEDMPEDLYLEIRLEPHPIFTPVDNDLHAELPVDLYTAILGGEATVPTLGKGKIKLKIPPESQSGRIFRLKGLGMPRLKDPNERGDLYVKTVVQLPENLSPEEIALFEELADMRGL